MTDAALGREPAFACNYIERPKVKVIRLTPNTPDFTSCDFWHCHPGHSKRVYHDLEAYYWVIVWIISGSRRIRHNDRSRNAEELFECCHPQGGVGKKYSWLLGRGTLLSIDGNAPFTELMRKFTSLVAKMAVSRYEDNLLTHEAVLGLLDEALGQPGWPLKDRAPPKPVPQSRRVGPVVPAPLKRSRTITGIGATPSVLAENTGPNTKSQSESGPTNPKRLKSGK